MTCSRCGRNFVLDIPSERCPLSDDTICPRCTLIDPSLHRCDMMCQARNMRFIKYHPLTDGWGGFGSMAQVTTTTEEFMPYTYRFIYGNVGSIEIVLKEMNTLGVVIKMQLSGNESLIDQTYVRESWKTMHLEKVLKEAEITSMEQLPAPLVILRPNRLLRVAPETLEIVVDGEIQASVLSDRHGLIGTPISDPPPDIHHFGNKEPEERGVYSYFGGKFSAIYGPLFLGKEYTISFDVEASNPIYSLDFLFPYRYVDLNNVSVSDGDYRGIHADSPIYKINAPVLSSKFTDEFEHKINRSEDERPEFDMATPFRKTPSIDGEELQKLIALDDADYPIALDDYAILSLCLRLSFSAAQVAHKLIVQAKATKRAIPIRTYEQMQQLPEYRDFLIRFDFLNVDHINDRALIVESEIVGFTERVSEEVIVPKLGMGKGPPARVILNQCPPLKVGILEAMSEPINANFSYKIYEKNGESRMLVASGNQTVRLLANDQIIWSLRDVMSGTIYNLEPTLASWVKPFDDNGLLEEVRDAAADFHKNKSLRGNLDGNATLEEQTMDVKALYDCLNQKYAISFGDHLTDYGFQYNDPYTAQRILTAEQVLAAKTGVCIDFVILFASLMEGIGINPLLIVSQHHAILGWGKHNTTEAKIEDMGFLETTALGQMPDGKTLVTFEQAQSLGREYFKKTFMFKNDSSVLLALQTHMGKVLVDLAEARKEGAIKKDRLV